MAKKVVATLQKKGGKDFTKQLKWFVPPKQVFTTSKKKLFPKIS